MSLLLMANPRHAWSGITEGVTWITTHQDSGGLWGGAKGTPFRDATTVVEALTVVGQGAGAVATALPAIQNTATGTTDYLARKIAAVAAGGDAALASVLGTTLVSMRNTDGGWGYRSGYGSSNLETALALIALKRAGYTNTSILSAGLSYLKTHRNVDNAWSLVQGGTSEVFTTAYALLALTLHPDVVSSTTEVNAGVTWLKTQDHGDGGYGSASVSNPYESGLAIAAMVRGGWAGADVTNARTYLLNTQQGNGSWNADAYGTALAIYGINHVGPDLSVRPSEFTLSIPSPLQGDVVTITAVVRNLGAQAATNVVTRFFDGQPGQGGVQIGTDQTVASLAVGGSASVQVSWTTASKAGDHSLVVVVDPQAAILESEEGNNSVTSAVHVRFPADLTVAGDGIAVTPAEPDTTDAVTIGVTVKNLGEATATNVLLQVYDAPSSGTGTPLLGAGYNIPSIAAGAQFTLNVNMGNYYSSSGERFIFACADVNNTIAEGDESNNCSRQVLEVGRVKRTYTTLPGLDLLALPVTPLSALTSYALLPNVLNGSALDKWDRTTQSYRSASISGGNVVGDNYSIDLLDGYFAHVAPGSFVEFVGRRVTTHPCTSLQTGLNIVSSPNSDACYSGYDLIGAMTGGLEAHRWDAHRQAWDSAMKTGSSTLIGSDFAVEPGYGYFVRVTAPSSWCVAACDTGASPLADLVVTTNDILLDPNPVQSGGTVGIYVNINNTGSVTAVTPHLTIYAGNPAAGGTLLLDGNLPVNVPAGGSSGYWGNTFVFNGAGSIAIYGIADKDHTIAESNETNNQGIRTLTVTTLAIEEARANGVAETPVLVGGPRAPKLALGAGVPAPLGRDARAAHEAAAASGNPGDAVSAATFIAGVKTSGLSSSSAVISWRTNGSASACVRYGTTTGLGQIVCDAAVSDVHQVVLQDLESDTPYFFEVVSDQLHDNRQGSYYTFRTTLQGAGIPSLVHGRVVQQNGTTPVAGALAFVTLQSGSGNSLPLVAVTGSDGRFVINLGNLKNAATSAVLPLPGSGTLVLSADAGFLGGGGKNLALGGSSPRDAGDIVLNPLTDVPGGSGTVAFGLQANVPNPFRTSTVIQYELAEPSWLRVEVFDLLGRRVRLLESEARKDPGTYRVLWDGRSDAGSDLPGGIYFYRLAARGFNATRKALLVRD